MEMRWRIELLGGLRAVQGERVVSRFRTQKSGLLLAYLAYYRHRPHRREALSELLWPEIALSAGRQNLRQALSFLRQSLEPMGSASAAVFMADRLSVQLRPEAVTTDVEEFDAHLQAARLAESPPEQTALLMEAVELYQGELLPGCFEEWVQQERQWLAERYFQALGELVSHLGQAGEFERAVEYARRGVRADPLREEAHRDLIRLQAAAGQPEAALRQYEELERLLVRDLAEEPSDESRALANTLRKQAAVASTTAAAEPPPLSVPSVPVGNLPVPLDRFFGRRSEMARLIRLLRPPTADSIEDEELLVDRTPTRLVTLTGPGGSGKTRLALEVARRLRQRWQGAVWFVPLGDLSDPRLILDKLLDVLRLPRIPQVEPLDQIVSFLSRQPSLLLLDNFEQLLPDGALSIETLLEWVGTLTVIVTSRQRLGVRGEQHFPVPPLPVPVINDDEDGLLSRIIDHGSLTANASASLLVDRARQVLPDFQVTEGNAAAVAALCRELEGLPLAIELAAGWIGVLTPTQILTRLREGARNAALECEAERTGRFDLLVGRSRSTPPRHRSLRAALDWSYQLLSPELQRFFTRLSVFRGGWSLDAARTVCEEPRALEYLEALQERSLVVTEAVDEEMRYRLLETLREYAAEQLDTQETERLTRRHSVYYLERAERESPLLAGSEQSHVLRRWDWEQDNLRAAIETLHQSGETVCGLRLCAAMGRFWEARSYLTEGRWRLSQFLALTESNDVSSERLQALHWAGTLAYHQGDLGTASSLHKQCLAGARASEDRHQVGSALHGLGMVAEKREGSHAARLLFEESLAVRRELGDRHGIASVLTSLGTLTAHQGDFPAAREFYRESLSLWEELGDRLEAARTLNHLGKLANWLDEYKTARDFCERSRAICRELNFSAGVAEALTTLAVVAIDSGDPASARPLIEQSLRIWEDAADESSIAAALHLLGWISHALDDCAAARSSFAESRALFRKLGNRWEEKYPVFGLALTSYRLGDFHAARAFYNEGLAIAREFDSKAPDLATSTLMQGQVAWCLQDYEAAEALYMECLPLLQELGDRSSTAGTLGSLGYVVLLGGDVVRGRTFLAESRRDTGA